MVKGIDISHHQNDKGTIDFQKVKQAGYDFVIVKAGGAEVGYYTDSCFEKNYAGAKSAGLHVGAYYFASAFTTAEQGRIQAQKFLDIIKGKTFDFPVYVDVERFAGNPKGATDATIAFCDCMERNGYFVGIYSSDISGFQENLEIDRLADYSKWVARYGSQPKYVKEYGIWQKSETGRVDGISGNVDLNECSVDYPAIIKGAGLNGFPKQQKAVEFVEKPVENPVVKGAFTVEIEGRTFRGMLYEEN
ncbi:MAG: glycoside hydrolase family 25 protein [Oscillospiraceae bacterium]